MGGVKEELQRLLTDPPYGALSAMARTINVTSASVSAWKYGQAQPEPERWADLEAYLGLPKGHLDRAHRGKVNRKVTATWPGLGATPPAGRVWTDERLDELDAEIQALRTWREESILLGDERQALIDELEARVASLEASQRLAG